MHKKILIVDAMNHAYRVMAFGTNQSKIQVAKNILSCFRVLVEAQQPDKILYVKEGKPVARYALLPEYKETRVPADSSFYDGIEIAESMLPELGVTLCRHPEAEADDLVHHYASTLCGSSGEDGNAAEIIIASSDTDMQAMIQGLPDNVKIYSFNKKTIVERADYDYISAKSLHGDPGDNIPGIKGVGKKTAMKLLSNSEDLQKFLSIGDNRAVFERNKLLISPTQVDAEKIALVSREKNIEKFLQNVKNMGISFSSSLESKWRASFSTVVCTTVNL